MGEVLLQEDVSEESKNSESQEKGGGKSEFENSLEGMSLQPIYFI